MRCFLVLLLALAIRPSAAHAKPLDLVPIEAELVVVVEDVTALVPLVSQWEAVRTAPEAIPAIREALQTTPVRRFVQFVRYAEQKLGGSWPALLERLAGRGAVLASRPQGDGSPVLLVLEGTDPATTQKAFQFLEQLLQTELPEVRSTFQKLDISDAEAFRFGDELFVARVGANLLATNKNEVLNRALALALGKKPAQALSDRAAVQATRKRLAPQSQAWLWYNLDVAKQDKGFADFVDMAAKEPTIVLAIGSTVDAIRRASSVGVGMQLTPQGARLELQLDAPRSSVAELVAFHLPQAGELATLPLLQPPGVLYSQSFYLDPARYWNSLLTSGTAQAKEDLQIAEKQINRFLPNTKLLDFLAGMGAHHRFVAARRAAPPLYNSEPAQFLPTMALVSTFRDPAQLRTATGALRLAGLFTSLQLPMTMQELPRDGYQIVQYRFPDSNAKYEPADSDNMRFNHAPAFAVIGNHLVMASEPRIIDDLVPELRRAEKPDSAAIWRGQLMSRGVVAYLQSTPPDALLATAILNERISLEQARQQFHDFCQWLDTVGDVQLALEHGKTSFTVTLDWVTRR
jgi:hypothetical protein